MSLLNFINQNFSEKRGIVSIVQSNSNLVRISQFYTCFLSNAFQQYNTVIILKHYGHLSLKSRKHHSLHELVSRPSYHVTSKLKSLLSLNQKSRSYLDYAALQARQPPANETIFHFKNQGLTLILRYLQ